MNCVTNRSVEKLVVFNMTAIKQTNNNKKKTTKSKSYVYKNEGVGKISLVLLKYGSEIIY